MWNCRGAGSKTFLRYLLLFKRKYILNIIILVETRVSSNFLHDILQRLNFTSFIVSEACGIWVLWNNSDMQVRVVTVNDQIVNLFVAKVGSPPWLLSAVYASTKPLFQNDLWRYMEHV